VTKKKKEKNTSKRSSNPARAAGGALSLMAGPWRASEDRKEKKNIKKEKKTWA